MADFPRLLHDAAAAFRNVSVAFAQIKDEGGIKVRMQILEIGRQFVGDVTYGCDPKGVLFYNDMLAFDISNADFEYHKYGSAELVTIEVYFFQQNDKTPYATFIARVHHDQVPHCSDGKGDGHWMDFKIGSAQGRAGRPSGSNELKFEFPALNKVTYITTTNTTRIDVVGIVLSQDLIRFITESRLAATVRSDIVLFHPRGQPKTILGLFIPSAPLDIRTDSAQVPATWQT